MTAAVVSAAAWWAADRKYLAIAAAACCVAFFLPVVLELLFGFDVVSFGIEAVRVHAFCEKDVLVGCFRVLVVCFSGRDVSFEFECEQDCECDFAPEHDWEAKNRVASSPAVGTGEQATGRVDVPGEAHNGIFKQKVAAASLSAASQHTPVLTERCVGSPLEKWEKDNPVSRIFVRDLMGKSVSLWVPSRITRDELSLAVSVATGVPLEFFYLTIEGHVIGGQDLLGRFGGLPGDPHSDEWQFERRSSSSL